MIGLVIPNVVFPTANVVKEDDVGDDQSRALVVFLRLHDRSRTRRPIMEPQEYYERSGLVIPNVVFLHDVCRGEDDVGDDQSDHGAAGILRALWTGHPQRRLPHGKRREGWARL